MCIAAAIAGGALLGAVGTAFAGSEAASATTSAAQTAAGVQEQALAQQARLAAPYTGLGQSAIPAYQALLGIGPGGAGTPKASQIQSTLANLPGYQFARTQGITDAENALSAEGLSLSGNAVEALNQFGTGLAEENYQSYLNDLLQPIQIGQGAAAGQAANIQTGASNLGNIAIGQGNNIAGIDANTIAGITRATGNAGNQFLTYQTLQNLGAQQNPNINPAGASYNPYFANPSTGYGTYSYDPTTYQPYEG